MLTEKKIKQYLKNQGIKCPFCDSDRIRNEGKMWGYPLKQTVSCDDCSEVWDDVYTLTGIIDPTAESEG